MDAKKEFAWTAIYKTQDHERAYGLELIFYNNKLPVQVRIRGIHAELWVPSKYKVLSEVVLDNALFDNLGEGALLKEPPQSLESKVYIDHSYERKFPLSKSIFWLLFALFPSSVIVLYLIGMGK